MGMIDFNNIKVLCMCICKKKKNNNTYFLKMNLTIKSKYVCIFDTNFNKWVF